MENKKYEGRTFYYKRTLLPYLAKVLEGADYDGKSVDFKVEVNGGIAAVTFEKEMVNNYTYNIYRKACRKMEKDVIFEK